MPNTPQAPRLAASNSFSPDEVLLLDYILSRLRLGQMPDGAVRMAGFAGLCRRAQAMKKRIAEIRKIKQGGTP
jgi:hypothetical protein